MGYDNIYYSNFLSPKLTTVENPTKDLGSISMSILIDAIESEQPLNGKYYTVGNQSDPASVNRVNEMMGCNISVIV